jgi:hypothetical protein
MAPPSSSENRSAAPAVRCVTSAKSPSPKAGAWRSSDQKEDPSPALPKRVVQQRDNREEQQQEEARVEQHAREAV